MVLASKSHNFAENPYSIVRDLTSSIQGRKSR